jgi:probable rRNA maturation factor
MSEPTARTRDSRGPRRASTRSPRPEPGKGRSPEGASVQAPGVTVANRQRRVPLDTAWLRRELARVAAEEDLRHSPVSVVLVSDRRIQRLNRDFHGRPQVTDVLAFDYGSTSTQDDVAAEVVVSAERAQAEARLRKLPPEAELLLYCIHGLLHLAGYEDATPAGRRRMWRRQRHHLSRAGFRARPGRRGLSWRAAAQFQALGQASPIRPGRAGTRSARRDGPRASRSTARSGSKR